MCTREPQVNIHKLHNSIINLNSACVCPCIYDRGPVKRSMHMEWCWHNVLGGVQRAGVLQGSKRWMCHSMQQLQASASSDSLPKEASPEAVSLFPSVWKHDKWPSVSSPQTLPPSQSPRAMKRPRDDKPYSGARHQQCPRLILSGTGMTPGKTVSSPFPFSSFQSTRGSWELLSSPVLLLKQVTLHEPYTLRLFHQPRQRQRVWGWRRQSFSVPGVLKEVLNTGLFPSSR